MPMFQLKLLTCFSFKQYMPKPYLFLYFFYRIEDKVYNKLELLIYKILEN